MKVKLYRRFVSSVCKLLRMSRKQLFNRLYVACILGNYAYDIHCKKLIKDINKISLLSHKCPLSQIWKYYDLRSVYFVSYWKHSHWRHFIQIRLDLGEKLDDIFVDVLNSKQIN